MEIASGALGEIALTRADLVLAFGNRDVLVDTGVAEQLAEQFPVALIAGCSTAGQFSQDRLVDEQVIITAVRFDTSRVASATEPIVNVEGSREVGRKLGASLFAEDLVAVLVLSDGTNCNGSGLVDGLGMELGEQVTIFGGLAADGADFTETVVIADGQTRSGVVTAVGFYGAHLSVSTGSKGGWEIFGPERTITSSDQNVLHELDGEPALELYSRYLGDRAAELPGSALLFPLAIRPEGERSDASVVRTILGVDSGSASMTFAGDMPLGWKAQLMRASFDGLIDGAEHAGASLDHDVAGSGLCIGVSCVGRRLVLGQRTDEELEAVVDLLPEGATFSGFYSYGELAPGLSGRCELHNQTMTLTLLQERDGPRS